MSVPQSLRLAWVPRVDGNFLKDSPAQLILQGSVAGIPMISGDCDDEGTLFTLSLLNITSVIIALRCASIVLTIYYFCRTDAETKAYIHSNYIPDATSDEVDSLLALYPSDITQGSPYGTSILNAITPQYKRLAALQGDLVFQAPRRFFLQQRSGMQPIWTYRTSAHLLVPYNHLTIYTIVTKRFKVVPILGSFHGSDLLTMYTASDMTDYLINFVAHGDPNGPTRMFWPRYMPDAPQLLAILDGPVPLALANDTFREEAIAYLTGLGRKYPV